MSSKNLPRKKQRTDPETPLRARLSARAPCTSTAMERDPVFVAAAGEMRDKFRGPVGPQTFLDLYLQAPLSAPAMPQIDRQSFKDVASLAPEPDMYDPLIVALEPFCEGITLVNTSKVEDPQSGIFLDKNIKPDIGAYKDGAIPSSDCITRAHDMVTYIELKNHDYDEPFTMGESEPFERNAAAARDTRGQLTVYANAIQATQFRTHSFSVFINLSRCRLIYWTRSCAVVTEAFDYTEEDWLAVFFWRMSHTDDAARGVDTTFVPLAKETPEMKKARKVLRLLSTDPLFKVFITDDHSGNVTSYILSKPFTRNHFNPLGRGTRCFEAYDCKGEEEVLLKDTWRVEGYSREGDIYRKLHEHKVSNIPGLLAAADVGGAAHTCGDTTMFRSNTPHRIHVHYRIVLDTIGSSLTEFKSTWQMVKAVHAAMIAHFEAATKAKILHRDISVGNIIIINEGGLLIDWELSKPIDIDEARAFERTGTWQFISVRLHRPVDERQVHNIGDDLESFLFVLAWIAAKYAPNEMPIAERTFFLQSFDTSIGGEGGVAKQSQLMTDSAAIAQMKLKEKFFSQVLKVLWHYFAGRYESFVFTDLQERDPEAAKEWLDKLESHDWMLATLDNALQDEDWKHATDARLSHQVIESSRSFTKGQKRRRSMASSSYPDLPTDHR